MNKIPKQKQTQFILVVLMTLLIVGGLWYSLIRYQQANLDKLLSRRKEARSRSSQMQETIKNSKEIQAELLSVSNTLAAKEEDMASGDLYISMFNTIRNFKTPYRVDIPQFASGGKEVDVDLLPKFPYKQCTVSISGTAHYFDLGKFVADFENRFPYSRVLNLELIPATSTEAQGKDELAFKMDIVSLVKPGGAHPINTP